MARLLLFLFFVAFMGFTAQAMLFGKIGKIQLDSLNTFKMEQ